MKPSLARRAIDRHPGNFSKYHGDFFLLTANCKLLAVKQPEAHSQQFAVQTPHEVRWVTVNSRDAEAWRSGARRLGGTRADL